MVQTGQYVQPGTVLATVVQRDPLLLRFDVPESDAQRLANKLPVKFKVHSENADVDYSAVISHVSQQANETSRMVQITAEIDDPKKEDLRPGAFAEVTVAIGASVDATVVPQTAVRPSEKGFLAYVVEDGHAHERVLTLGMRTAEGLVEVRSGLKAGEQLVVRGAEALQGRGRGAHRQRGSEGAGRRRQGRRWYACAERRSAMNITEVCIQPAGASPGC